MPQPQLRLVLFYVSSFLGVATLFTVVTQFGETQLHAAENIEGIYQLQLADPKSVLRTCLKSVTAEQQPSLLLDIHQSGLFLNASLHILPTAMLTAGEIEKVRENRPTLMGQWHQNQMTVKGKTSQDLRVACPVLDPDQPLEIQFSVQDNSQDQISGKLVFGTDTKQASNQPQPFVGKLAHRSTQVPGQAKTGH